MRQAGDVTYADAHNDIRGEGIVEFASKKDMEKALDMLDGCEFNGKQITLIREKDRRYISGFSLSDEELGDTSKLTRKNS